MCVSHAVYCQTENVINSILEESLVNYFNIQDSIRMKNNITKQKLVNHVNNINIFIRITRCNNLKCFKCTN